MGFRGFRVLGFRVYCRGLRGLRNGALNGLRSRVSLKGGFSGSRGFDYEGLIPLGYDWGVFTGGGGGYPYLGK